MPSAEDARAIITVEFPYVDEPLRALAAFLSVISAVVAVALAWMALVGVFEQPWRTSSALGSAGLLGFAWLSASASRRRRNCWVFSPDGWTDYHPFTGKVATIPWDSITEVRLVALEGRSAIEISCRDTVGMVWQDYWSLGILREGMAARLVQQLEAHIPSSLIADRVAALATPLPNTRFQR
ncbi:MAG: hypothetical protein FDZ70_10670 [Actinobacteria bacterium]|nr:MAG: hypothetical protein FDZ70_10670 [Actinomycetota bacterium]